MDVGRWVTLSDVEPEPYSWIWREHIPAGELIVIAGRPGAGKGLVSLHIAADISQESVVIISQAEDRLRKRIRPYAEAAGANLKNIEVRDPYLNPYDPDAIYNYIVKVGATALIMDPIAAHGVDIMSNVRPVLDPMTQIADQTGCAFILTSHMIKSVSRRAEPLSAVGGPASGLQAVARAVYLFGKHPNEEDGYVLAQAKPLSYASTRPSLAFDLDSMSIEKYDVEDGAGLMRYKGISDVEARDLLPATSDSDEPKLSKLEEASEWLIDFLRDRDGKAKAKQIEQAARSDGHMWITVRRAAKAIEIKKPKGGRNSMWELPTELQDAEDGSDGD